MPPDALARGHLQLERLHLVFQLINLPRIGSLWWIRENFRISGVAEDAIERAVVGFRGRLR